MQLYQCKMCGGNVSAVDGEKYGVCDSCGSTMTLPGGSDERIMNLFNRANYLRISGEFDKAAAAYENILLEDNENAEAHWGALLCRYGIEYVEDPQSHERIPTCHRVQFEPLLSDPDYIAACQYAPDGYSRGLYEEQGAAIADIQKTILAVSRQEEPYDIFICYKETNGGSARTRDSVKAQEIYYALTDQGYRVFFSRISLENKLGKEYEPYIFAALNSAKVMLVVGARKEHFDAVWVKNEWSRFLSLNKQDRARLLIPCYQDMSPYDLPEELSYLQAQDMGRIGFLQDLLHGIKKILSSGAEKQAAEPGESARSANGDISALVKRMYIFLEDGDFDNALRYSQRILDIQPEQAEGYLGKLMADKRLRNISQLANEADLAEEPDCRRALRYAAEPLRTALQKCVNDGPYQRAVQLSDKANTLPSVVEPLKLLCRLPGFKDADQRLAALQDKASRILDSQSSLLKAADILPLIAVLREAKETCDVSDLLQKCCAAVYKAASDLCRSSSSGGNDEAAALFEKLENYKDSAQKAKDCRTAKLAEPYRRAMALRDSAFVKEDFAVVENAFLAAGEYSDAAAMARRYRAQYEAYDGEREKAVEETRRKWKKFRRVMLLILFPSILLIVMIYLSTETSVLPYMEIHNAVPALLTVLAGLSLPLAVIASILMPKSGLIRRYEQRRRKWKYKSLHPTRYSIARLLGLAAFGFGVGRFIWMWSENSIFYYFEDYWLDPYVLCIVLLMISFSLFASTRKDIPLRENAPKRK